MRRVTYLLAGAALGSLSLAAPMAAASPAFAAGPSGSTLVQVPSGITAKALPDATQLGATAAETPETVSFVLKERNEAQLEAAVDNGMTRFLTVSQFASEYGQSQATVTALRNYLASFGITSTAYADRIDVVATGTADQFNEALSTQQAQFKVPAIPAHDGAHGVPAQTVHAAVKPAELPRSIASSIEAVLGLSNYAPFGTESAHVDTSVTKPVSGSSNECLTLTGLPDACNLPTDYASNYDLNSLYRKGAEGAHQTIAIVTLAALDEGAPEYFWSNVEGLPNTGRTVTVQNIDGGPGAPSDAAGTGETDLDVEQSGGLAPDSNVIVYQAPNTDYGFADAYFAAASQNIASSVSASWAESETYLAASIAAQEESPAYEAAFDEAFLEMAAQGQSAFTAAGDWGAYTASVDLGTTNLSVAASADSPYITAAGGTTLPWSGTLSGSAGTATVNVPTQRTWGWDYLWQPVATVNGVSLETSAEAQVIGSGGGYSTIEPTPSYQARVPGIHNYHAVEYLTPTDPEQVLGGLTEPTSWQFNATPSVTRGTATGRAVPDASADADPYSGYLLYEPSAVPAGGAALQGGWGGTSFVAPQFNGSAAVIDSYLGHRVGLWNPFLYRAALSGNSPFTVLSSAGTGSDNIFYTGNPGQIYNPGSGLGYPNLGKLAADLAAYTGR